MKKLLLAIFSLIIVSAGFAQVEKAIPARPNPPRLVNDYTNTLTPSQKEGLEAKLKAYDDSTSTQIAVVMVETTGDYDVADYALAILRGWGVGGAEHSNGVVILVAKGDRRMRIETGFGMEGAVPDITAKSIIDNSLTPNFKADNYYRGLDQATDDIIAAAAGEYKAPANYGSSRKKKPGFWSIVGIIIMLLVFGGAGGRKGGGGLLSSAGWIIGSMMASGGRSGGGGWSGGGGGGGFGGFGGGSGGGGGASGSW